MSFCINPRCPDPKNLDNVLFCQACGSELLLEGRYRVVRILGGGGFGKTYDLSSSGDLKVLKVLIDNAPKRVELFQREAQVLQQLNHPGIPKVESKGYFVFPPSDGGEPVHCLVMEKIDGDNLREYIQKRQGRPINGELAQSWLIELVTILQQVHNQDILHRDIKPENIMLKPDGKLALIDFGGVREGTGTELATGMSGSGTEGVTQAGRNTSLFSRTYTPPEQIEGHPIRQSDFFALGRTFVYLLTGKDANHQSMYDPYNDRINWLDHASGVSPQLAALLDQMMERVPSKRPANTQAILQQLQAMKLKSPSQPSNIDDPLPLPSPPVEPIQPPSARKKSPLPIIAGATAAVIGITIGTQIFYSSSTTNRSNSASTTSTKSSCTAEITGNVRSEPSAQANNQTVIGVSEASLPLTGRKTIGGWVEVKLSNGSTAWTYGDKVANYAAIGSCLTQTVDDAGLITSQPQQQQPSITKPSQVGMYTCACGTTRAGTVGEVKKSSSDVSGSECGGRFSWSCSRL